MTTVIRHRGMGLLALLVVMSACTDKRPQQIVQEPVSIPPPPPIIQSVADIQFDGGVTEVNKLTVSNGSLYLTGKPFAFSRWDLSADPESPTVVFAASDNILTEFAPPERFGPWLPDLYASGALVVIGNSAFMSGTAGMSVVSFSDTHHPREVARFPVWQNDEPTSDGRFVYKAMLKHPTRPIIYGFRQQDFIFALTVNSLANVVLGGKASYPGGNACCAKSVAYFGNRAYLALGTKLQVYDLPSNGSLSYKGQISTFEAVNVYSTSKYLYVHHRPTSFGGSGFPTGIYIFDRNLKLVTSLPIDPFEFAVHDNDTHVYVNENDQTVRVYRILWENISRQIGF